jgi:hypothetical protein
MKSYTIAKASGAPDRDAIEPLRADCVLWEPDCGVRMEQKLCYDDTALYVFQRAWESDIRAECSAPLSPVHEDSCMEFFFSLTDDGRYVNFEINPNAYMELGFGPNRRERVRLCHKNRKRSVPSVPGRRTAGRRNTASRSRSCASSIRSFPCAPAFPSVPTATNAAIKPCIRTFSRGTPWKRQRPISTGRSFSEK